MDMKIGEGVVTLVTGPSVRSSSILYFIIFFTHAITHIYIAYLWVVDCRLEFPVIFISSKTKAEIHLVLIKQDVKAPIEKKNISKWF